MNALDPADLEALRVQLGREPRGVLAVESRCPAGHPQVIKVYPLLKSGGTAEPFPTLFWLTCPAIITQISVLEHDGWIARLEDEMQADPAFRERVERDHRAYIEERWATLSLADRKWIRRQGWASFLLERGIGGIEDWAHIKCLHLHAAHHLARSNAIGACVAALGVTACGASD